MDPRSTGALLGKVYTAIDDKLTKMILDQHVFFVATAPVASEGNLNLSPKGLDSLRILGPTTVAYLDVVGSGVETIAHLKENGRIVLMFCAFDGQRISSDFMGGDGWWNRGPRSFRGWPRSFRSTRVRGPSSSWK